MKSRWESNATGMLAVMIAALVLRVIRIGLGLPDFLEEAIPFRLALDMHDPATGAIHFNPHAFNYPSLSIYIHLAVQQALYMAGHVAGLYANWADYVIAFWRDPTPMVLGARWVGIVADLFTVLGVMFLARRLRAGSEVVAGLIVALAPALITTSHSIYCDPIMTAFAVWSVDRAAAWLTTRNRSHLVQAAILAGLAAGAKYPAAVAVVAIAVMIMMTRRREGLPLVVLVFAVAGITFCLTTPYAILSYREFVRDLSFEGAHAQGGHFGSLAHRSFLFHLR